MIFNASFFNSTISVPIYGLPGEKITLTPVTGTAVSVTIPSNVINGSVTKSLAPGSYTVTGDLTNFNKVITVNASTTSIKTGQAYFWDGMYVSGGFTTDGYSSTRQLGGTQTVGDTLFVTSGSSPLYRDSYLGTANAQNLSDINTLYYTVVGGYNIGKNSKVGVSTSKLITSDKSNTPSLITIQPTAINTTVSIDVSSWNGNAYPFIVTYVHNYGGYGIEVSRIWGTCT